MKVVVATGVFEAIHPGHILYLEKSRALGEKLVVIVARDKTVLERKNRKVIPETQRQTVVSALKPVDEAVLGDEEDWFKTIQEINPDIITIGPDQDFDINELREKLDENSIPAQLVKIESHWNGVYNSSKKISETINGK